MAKTTSAPSFASLPTISDKSEKKIREAFGVLHAALIAAFIPEGKETTAADAHKLIVACDPRFPTSADKLGGEALKSVSLLAREALAAKVRADEEKARAAFRAKVAGASDTYMQPVRALAAHLAMLPDEVRKLAQLPDTVDVPLTDIIKVFEGATPEQMIPNLDAMGYKVFKGADNTVKVKVPFVHEAPVSDKVVDQAAE